MMKWLKILLGKDTDRPRVDYRKLRPTVVYQAFSQGNTIFSRLIRIFGSSRFSHAFFLYWDERFGIWMALGADAGGWMLTPADTEHVLAAIAFRPEKVDLWAGLRSCALFLGSSYDFTAILGMTWVEAAWHLLKKKVRNPLQNSHAWFCSEICSYVDQLSGVPLALDSGATDPEMLYRRLQDREFDDLILEDINVLEAAQT